MNMWKLRIESLIIESLIIENACYFWGHDEDEDEGAFTLVHYVFVV